MSGKDSTIPDTELAEDDFFTAGAKRVVAERIDGRKRGGFASMTPERRREIASQGGKTAHARGKARHWTSETARLAGLKGGASVSADREHMSEIGRKGGHATKGIPRKKRAPVPMADEAFAHLTGPRDLHLDDEGDAW